MRETDCICTTLRRSAHASTAFYDRALEPSGLRITTYRLLRQVAQPPGPNISELAARLELERSTLGRNLKVAERDGFVRLVGGDDERSRLVELTPLGEKALETARPLWARAQRDVKRLLGKDLIQALDALKRLNG